jgi:hypothetical protein
MIMRFARPITHDVAQFASRCAVWFLLSLASCRRFGSDHRGFTDGAVGGKTGTSVRQVDGETTGTAYFVGFAPADDPKMVVSIIVNDVGAGVNGNRHAASLFP